MYKRTSEESWVSDVRCGDVIDSIFTCDTL